MAAWPSTLPRPLTNGYALRPQDQVLRTEMEVGAGRTRRRTATRNDRVNVSWLMTDTQLAIFRTWFDNSAEAAGGASWFTTSLAIGTTGFTSITAKFIGPFEAKPLGGKRWSVTAELELR